MAQLVPSAVEIDLVRHLFAEADRLNWVHLNLSERSRQYKAWLLDPRVGGVLRQFMAGEEARVWLKDGPMKEFARALHGQGKYADLVIRQAAAPQIIVQSALGKDWKVIQGSQKIKPLRVRIQKNDQQAIFAWGPIRDFKHLVWAALTCRADDLSTDWVLCLTSSFVNPTPKNVQFHNIRLAEMCGLKVVHLPMADG